ncbi:MAG: glycosyltransferase family 2 protein [Anaerolineae bacterium]|nr:glycosyltransferase family 2 protein [Anaerolineae bacterium]
MPDLGIVIVSYNVRDLLRDCLESIFSSRGDLAFEVCVVDNDSHDGSADMVAAEFPQVRLVRAENRGYAAGNNLGFRAFGFGSAAESTGVRPRYVLLLNPDTLLPPSALADMVGFLEERPGAGIAGPRLVREDGSLDRACRRSFPTPEVAFYHLSRLSRLFPHSRRFGRYNVTYLPPDVTTEVDSVVGAFMLIRADVLDQIGPLDEQYFMYAEDLDFCYRAKRRGWQVWYNAAVTVLHYKGQSSRQRSTFANIEFYRTMRLFHDKHYKDHTFFVVNWLIYGAIGLMGGLALMRDWLRPVSQRGVASAVPVSDPREAV